MEKKKIEKTRTLKENQENEEPLPLAEFHGRIYFQSNFEGCAVICDEIIQRIDKCNEEIVPIGFDLEWPVFPRGAYKGTKTALAQLCLSPRTCHLFHLYNIDRLPAAFIVLLGHPKVKLVGVNVVQDVRKLGRDFSGFPTQRVVENNCVDCGKFANQHYDLSERWSLTELTRFLLKKRLDKRDSVRKSMWQKLPLTEAQKKYAATDAYVSLLTYLSIKEKIAECSDK